MIEFNIDSASSLMGFILPIFSVVFIAMLGLNGYIRRELPTHLQISMHLCRKTDERYQLKNFHDGANTVQFSPRRRCVDR